jgi:signal transduction histidine kinase/CheY-like chemotaxis protein
MSHAISLQVYAHLGQRRDRAFRVVVTGLLVFLSVLNQWASLRGTVLALEPLPAGGALRFVAIRTPPGASLAVLYLAVLAVQGYGLVTARTIWRRDRTGAVLVAVASTANLAAATIAILVDFAHVKAPYTGAWPMAIFVLCVSLFLARTYAARGVELRVKSQFLASVSHEIRNPLHIILGYAQILDRDATLADVHRKKIKIVRRSGQHLLTLFNDVLEMSKIDAGRQELVEDSFDLWTTLDEVQRMFADEAAAKGIALSVERAPGLPRALWGDGAKVRQILINLASNALKFTSKGSIRLQASAAARADGAVTVELVVSDTGIGISAQDAARVFRPFEQLSAGKRAGGTGLGLAISLAHARLMGGDLVVESAPGVGSAFTVTFVAKLSDAEARLSTTRESIESLPGLRRCKVLVVDDLAVNRDVLSELFSAPGFETRTAEDGEAAVAIHGEWRPDLVLVDLRMPGMSGLEVIRRIKAVGAGTGIGALTASTVADDEGAALAAGADFFIRKPYNQRELLERISAVLLRRQAS